MPTNQLEQDLKINGSMTVSGGSFNQVSINGSGTINGDVQCTDFKIQGSCKINGNLKAETGVIRGSAKIIKDLFIHTFDVYGSSALKGGLFASAFTVRGTCSIDEEINTESISIYGRLEARSNCYTEQFYSDGMVFVNGEIQAKEVNMYLHNSKSKIKKITSDKITIRREKQNTGFWGLLKSLFSFKGEEGQLLVEEIKGEHIYLEAATVEKVQGHTIELGPGCHVEMVEYTGTLKVDERAQVESRVKVS